MSTAAGVATHTGMDDALARLKLLAWLSPSFPVGSFAFSGGLEWAVEAGDIVDAHGLAGWLDDLLRHGAPCTDAVMLAAAWHQPADLVELNGLALALTSSSERRLELAAQGTAFLVAVAAAWPAAGLQQLSKLPEVAYPIAVGCTAAAHAVPLLPTLEAFLLASIANMVSAALRLGVVGQSEAQTLIAKAAPATARLARWAETTTLDDLGGCAWRAEIASMRHETQYSRLFRS